MDFEEFARGFRARTAQRMLDFEKSLAKAQEDLEKGAREAHRQVRQQGPGATGSAGAGSPQVPSSSGGRGYDGFGRHDGHNSAPAHPQAPGQVKSVLRRD